MQNDRTKYRAAFGKRVRQGALAIMEASNTPDRKVLLAVLNQVGAMERQLDAAVKELAAMRRELSEVQGALPDDWDVKIYPNQ